MAAGPRRWCGPCPTDMAVVDEAITTGVLRPRLPPLDRAGPLLLLQGRRARLGHAGRARREPGPRRADAGAVRRRRRLGDVLAAGPVDRGPRAAAGRVRRLRTTASTSSSRTTCARMKGESVERDRYVAMDITDPPRRLRRPGGVDGRGRHPRRPRRRHRRRRARRARRRAVRTWSRSPSPRPNDGGGGDRPRAAGRAAWSATAGAILDGIDWAVHERRAVGRARPQRLGQDHACCASRRCYLHPTAGTVDVLGQRLGRIDVRQLRARIGLTSAALADQLRPDLDALDVVMTAKHAALEPWWHTLRRRRPQAGGHVPGPPRRRRPGRARRSARCRRASASGCCWPARS